MAERARIAIVATVLALAAAAPAHAASVSVVVPYCASEQSKYGACYPDEAVFKAAPGEANQVTITRAVSPPNYQPKITIVDAGAPLTAATGCTQGDEHTVSCTGYSLIAVVNTGDGDDTIEGPGRLDGGPGNDVLNGDYILAGGPGDDRLEGGAGGEYLQGGAGHDTLVGGAGSDTLEPDDVPAGERDVVQGGDGVDTVTYQARKDGIRVSLAQPLAGEDELNGIENVRGGAGADTLTGDAGRNTLEGGAGNDVLDGTAGSDLLGGDAGADRLNGGDGADELDSGGGRLGEQIACGAQRDIVDAGPNTLVGSDCEQVGRADLDLVGTLALKLPLKGARGPVASLRGTFCLDRPCVLATSVTAVSGRFKGRTLGSQRRAVSKARRKLPRAIGIGLSRDGADLLRRAGSVRARVTVVVNDFGDVSRTSFLVLLERG